MPQLPSELYREILQHVTCGRDLCALSTVSRVLNNEAEHFLYHFVNSTNRVLTKSICELIIHCPRVRPHVRRLSMRNNDNLPHEPIGYWDTVAAALRTLQNLEALRVSDGLDNCNGWVLRGCTFSLRELDVDFMLDPPFLEFLNTQREILALGWTDGFPSLSSTDVIPRNAGTTLLPALRELTTNCPAIALAFLPGRALTHVWIGGPCAHDDESWLAYMAAFGAAAGGLRSLRLNFPFNKRILVALLSRLAKDAPHLRSLGFLPYFNTQDKVLISAIAEHKKLESVVTWSVISADASRALAEACPSLRLVACLHYSYSHEYVFMPVNPLGVPRAVHDPDFRLWRDA
ncbi:hypothetical protein B0H21DRAFT_106349 [Amylocystis lapponica]|nr:hypothetical protein B0H21DRAFT_106349 [Amylocystis lapponica]